MSEPPVNTDRAGAGSRSISSVPAPPATSSSSSTASSAFGSKSSSVSRKKPAGLDISRSIPKPSRIAPRAPGTKEDGSGLGAGAGSDEASLGSAGGSPFVSESDRLRDEIAKLQLSSKSSSSSFASGPSSPTSLAVPGDKDKASRKKSSSSIGGKKKKNDDDLVKDADLEILADLGAGNGGTVTKVWNKKRECVMARKLILVDAKPSVRKQILRELQIMSDCSSPYIVGYYGCFPVDVHVGVVMEFMDAGSLDGICRQYGAIPIAIVGKVAEAVLEGLLYLYKEHRIIHRDIKPSNILANSLGQIKIADFGVSGELINSIANTFVGTSTYMSPERIQGAPYTIKSDVWSLGISLVELAHGRFPFSSSPDSSSSSDEADDADATTPVHAQFDPDATLPLAAPRPNLEAHKRDSGNGNGAKKKDKGVSLGGGGMTMSILDLLQHIVNEPAPTLGGGRRRFPEEAIAFVDGCLDKDPNVRKSPQELLESDWIKHSTVTPEDLRQWAQSVTSAA